MAAIGVEQSHGPRPALAGSCAKSNNPSAPNPRWRSQTARASDGSRSRSGASRSSISRKSFPNAWALMRFIDAWRTTTTVPQHPVNSWPMRPRDTNRLASTSYDVLVVGGGILGLACAYEAASRGLSVALIDAGDFGSGTTFNHQKTVHGGLRALQTLAIGRARESIRERRALARIAPWLLRPLPFLTGTYRSMTRGRARPARGLCAGRMAGATAQCRRRTGAASAARAAALEDRDLETLPGDPGRRPHRRRAVVRLSDGRERSADVCRRGRGRPCRRRSRHLRRGARDSPGRIGRIAGVRARDAFTGQDVEVRAQIVVNAAGARAADILRMLGVTRPFPLLKAMNLLTSKPAADIALAAPDPRGRMLTLVPWRGRAIVGTGQSPSPAASGDDGVTAEEVERFIADANHAFPALKLGTGDVTLVHRGLVPAVTGRDGSVDLLQTPTILDHAPEGADGSFTVTAAKYTTARATAERVTNAIGRKLRKRAGGVQDLDDRPALRRHRRSRGARDRNRPAHRRRARLPLLRHLMGRYAEGAATIVKLIGERPDSSRRSRHRPLPSPPRCSTSFATKALFAWATSSCAARRWAPQVTPGAAGSCGDRARELGWRQARRLGCGADRD